MLTGGGPDILFTVCNSVLCPLNFEYNGHFSGDGVVGVALNFGSYIK